MKKKMFALFAVCVLAVCLCVPAFADADIDGAPADQTFIPDPNYSKIVAEKEAEANAFLKSRGTYPDSKRLRIYQVPQEKISGAAMLQ